MKTAIRMNLIGPEIRNLRHAHSWTQAELAERLCWAGWQITRSDVAKIEAQLVVIPDYELLYFTQLFEVSYVNLFPKLDQRQSLTATLNRLITRRPRCFDVFRNTSRLRK